MLLRLCPRETPSPCSSSLQPLVSTVRRQSSLSSQVPGWCEGLRVKEQSEQLARSWGRGSVKARWWEFRKSGRRSHQAACVGGGGGYREERWRAEGHSGQCRAGRSATVGGRGQHSPRGTGSRPPELPPLGSAGPTLSLELSAIPLKGPGPLQGEDHFCCAKPCQTALPRGCWGPGTVPGHEDAPAHTGSQDHGFVLPALLQSPDAQPEADQPCGRAFFTLTFQMGSGSEAGSWEASTDVVSI